MKDSLNIYYNLLVYKNSPIHKDKQIEIFDFLFDKFVQCNKDLLMLGDGQIKRLTSRQQFETLSKMEMVNKFPDIDIQSYDEEKSRYKWNIKIKEIYDTITGVNQFQLLKYTSDLFAPHQQVTKNNHNSQITVIGNKLHIKKVSLNTKENNYLEIVSDYKKHFKYFDELLDLIVDMRLAKDRKASFLHLRVKSDWGKSFLSGILNNIDIAFEIDYHNLMNKGANDISPIQVRNSFVMILDEFNNFSSEMKKLSHSFSFAPKFGMREDVELYLKILMSAEKSPSFSGGVDEQIINRVMVMDIPDNEIIKLIDRETYKKYGNIEYMEALEYYSYMAITKRLKDYLSMEKYKAHKIADGRVREAVKKYKMKNIEDIKDNIRNVINEAIEEILNSTDMDINPKFREIRSNIIEIEKGKYENNIFIRQPLKTFEIIVKSKVSENEFKKMRYKLNDFEDIIYLVADKRKTTLRLKNTIHKGLVISLKHPKSYMVEEKNKEDEVVKEYAVLTTNELIVEAKELF